MGAIEEIPEELAVLGEKSGVQREEPDEEALQEPFDPQEISIASKGISLDAVIRRINTNTIRLSPDFQRNVVWDNKRKSLLIESLMLNIPIAMFYVSDDGKGNWEVVDGLQRLTAIKEFIVDKKFKLEKLEFWTQYNGKGLDDLPPIPYNQIMETEFNFVIIQPTTQDVIKYNIFKRINTGGLPLSNQEIRHALYQGEGTKLLYEYSLSDIFLLATDRSINDSRMVARELILRCLTFMILGTDGYASNDTMDTFLNKGLRILNFLENPHDKRLEKDYGKKLLESLSIKNYKTLKQLFDLGMTRNFEIFDKNAFRISLQNQPRSPINKSLFETWGGLLASLSESDFRKLMKKKDTLLSQYDKKKKEENFYRAVSRDAWKKSNVDYRFTEVSKLIWGTINDK
ncbi:hypothetical protein AGMMS50230_10930 [Spirochaetia bacterium]|nr:hypothetical protein AGMMS50230_10930 [Spirochaetia bacterium]